MAETLGSLVDKLTIKDLRGYHLKEMLKDRGRNFSSAEIKEKIGLLEKQKKSLIFEIEGFIAAAIKGRVKLREEKLKLYNPKETIGRIPVLNTLGEAVSYLAQKNLELWHLEDEARRKDVSLSYIGKIKGQIDFANQQRNDLIDKIDDLFERKVKQKKNKTK